MIVSGLAEREVSLSTGSARQFAGGVLRDFPMATILSTPRAFRCAEGQVSDR